MPGTLTITLDPPIKVGAGQIEKLDLREPTGCEMRDAEKELAVVTPASVDNYQITLIARVAGIADADKDATIGALPVSIMRQATAFVEAFDSGSGKRPDPLPSKLDLPVDIISGGIAYKTLSLQEPTVGQRRRANATLSDSRDAAAQRQYQMVLVAQVSGMPFAAVEQLPVSTLNDAEAYCVGFFTPGPLTGSA